MGHYLNLSQAIEGMISQLKLDGQTVDPGHWQGVETAGHPEMVTREILNASFTAPMLASREGAEKYCEPNIPWAETEFQERVGGEPHNPHDSMQSWPWWHGQIDEKMSHTYSERFWAKFANGVGRDNWRPKDPKHGIRYDYGDLNDVLKLLRQHPLTRQATFPIFFPEDTGAVHGGRIPCTLHYHFLLRNDRLHLWYPIRSCDAVRHFRDDVYMAVRLAQWVIERLAVPRPGIEMTQWANVYPGMLHFTAYSFHVHAADEHLL